VIPVLQSTTKGPRLVSPANVYTVRLSDCLALRVYSDTRPHIWKIASLQKGLILICEEVETVGEGTGFGVPILIYQDETYFSGTSNVHVSQEVNSVIIYKEFFMDRLARNTFRNVTLENRTARAMLGYTADLYQKHKRFRFLTLKNLTGKLNVGKAFIEVPSIGRVSFTYRVKGNRVFVRTDLKQLKRRNLERVFLLNEQGADVFRKYSDSNGTELLDEKIRAWDRVNTDWADLTNLQGGFGFRLRNIREAILRRGREYLNGSLNWVGLDYEIDSKRNAFEYEIEILGV
jgi:hypothetical protein